MPPLRAVIVAAVSTAAQAEEDKASIPQQLAAGRETCAARHWNVVAEISIPGHSRNYDWLDQLRADCPEYDDLIRLVDTSAVDVIVCRDYDRLWRTVSLQSQVMARCKQSRVQILSLGQPAEIVSPEVLADRGTELSPIIFSWLSEEENRIRVRRRQVGMLDRVRRGLYNASTTPYGYNAPESADATMTHNEPEARWVRWMYERRAEGWGYTRILRRLEELGAPAPAGGRWHTCTVRGILHNDVYVGVVRWGSAVNREGLHPRIIDDVLWGRVQRVNGSRQGQFRSANVHALTGLVTCGECGWTLAYTRHTRDGDRCYLRCQRYERHRDACHFGHILAPTVERVVYDAVYRAFGAPDVWLDEQRARANGHEVATRIAAIDADMAEQQARFARWNSLYERGGITDEELLAHRQRIIGAVEALREERETLDRTRRDVDASHAHLVALATRRSAMPTATPEELRDLYREVIERVVVHKRPARRIEVFWK